mmetsp:Transcript_26725/g.50878  ORF Transcript_26725/g.50878 Transcript_26725/m.50878 type:complete len:229 (-) Transcript_26725:2452-3138(-)
MITIPVAIRISSPQSVHTGHPPSLNKCRLKTLLSLPPSKPARSSKDRNAALMQQVASPSHSPHLLSQHLSSLCLCHCRWWQPPSCLHQIHQPPYLPLFLHWLKPTAPQLCRLRELSPFETCTPPRWGCCARPCCGRTPPPPRAHPRAPKVLKSTLPPACPHQRTPPPRRSALAPWPPFRRTEWTPPPPPSARPPLSPESASRTRCPSPIAPPPPRRWLACSVAPCGMP